MNRSTPKKNFSAELITDQKRLVRGEQLLYARRCLRIRDMTHHSRWRIMVLPGRSPIEEISALKHLMSEAYIVAVDKDEQALAAALTAGADEIVRCDLSNFQIFENNSPRPTKCPAAEVDRLNRFDLIALDLCSNANQQTKELISVYRQMITPRGVLLISFSYGRDVVERFDHEGSRYEATQYCRALDESEKGWSNKAWAKMCHLLHEGAERHLIGRLHYLLPASQLAALTSVMIYRGNQMPMCSVLLNFDTKNGKSPPSFVRVGAGDFEIAVTNPDPSIIYATPQERIDALRRKHAALKAVYTRQLRQTSEASL